MAVDTLCSNKPIELVEKGDIVDRNWKLNMARMTGARPRVHATSRTATLEVISFNKQNNISPKGRKERCLHMVSPSTQSRIVKSTGNRIVERIQGGSIMDSFHRDGFDFFVGVETKVNSRDGRWHRT